MFRKLVVRIVQKRLSKVFVKKQQLKGANFTELPNKNTIASIYILNNIIEDTIQKEKKL